MAVETKEISSGTSGGSNFVSVVFDTHKYYNGGVQVNWSGFNNTNATMILQGAVETAMGYNDLGGASGGIVCTSTANTQLWEFKEFTARYVRLSHVANDV